MPKGIYERPSFGSSEFIDKSRRIARTLTETLSRRTEAEKAELSAKLSIAIREGKAKMTPEGKRLEAIHMSAAAKLREAGYTVEEKVAINAKISRTVHQTINNRTFEEWSEISQTVSEGVNKYLRSRTFDVPCVPSEFAEWFTGFFEGDGCVIDVHNSNAAKLFDPKIVFGMEHRKYFDYIIGYLPAGRICSYYVKGKQYWTLRWSSQKTSIPVARLLANYVVTEVSCNRLNVVLERAYQPLATLHELTLNWIAGFWDAEGNSHVAKGNGCFKVSIGQNNRNLLQRVRDFLNCGRVYPHSQSEAWQWVVCDHDAKRFADVLIPLSHYPEKREILRANAEKFVSAVATRKYIREHKEMFDGKV